MSVIEGQTPMYQSLFNDVYRSNCSQHWGGEGILPGKRSEHSVPGDGLFLYSLSLKSLSRLYGACELPLLLEADCPIDSWSCTEPAEMRGVMLYDL